MTETETAAGKVDDDREMSEKLFGRTILASMILGFAILACVVVMTGWLLVRSTEFSKDVDHTYTVETEIADFQVLVERAEAARRGFVLTAAERYTQTFAASSESLVPSLGRIRRLTADNPEQQKRLDELDRLIAAKLRLMRASFVLRRSSGVAAATAAFQRPEEQVMLERIRVLGAEMNNAEQALLIQRSDRQTANGRLLLAVVIAAGLLLGLLALGSTWVMRRFARDLTRSRSALRRMNEGLEAAVRERTADLTRANDEIQRFAYIVSHDLRSPLVNIMGFTSELETASAPLRKMMEEVKQKAPELVSKDAAAAVELDLPESISFIRSSTQKMDRLISAILRLSREGRRSLHPEPLDMDALADGIIQSLKRQADDKGAVVSVEGSLPQIVSDRVAIEQVLSNLVENAVKYLKPGRPGVVKIRGRVDGARVMLEVEDNGRGVDARDHERIFGLFRRAGPQDQPGEGIGLAHVRALTYRLGGLIDCVSTLDQGATFRLSLPRILAREIGEVQ